MAKRKSSDDSENERGRERPASKRRTAAKRDLIDTGTDKRYVRRNPDRAATKHQRRTILERGQVRTSTTPVRTPSTRPTTSS